MNEDLERLVEERTAELKLLNARLQASEARFRAAAQTATNIVWTTDALGAMRGEQADWSAFTGQTFNDYQGDGWKAKVHPDDLPATIEAWTAAVARGNGRFTFENRLLRNDGKWRLCRVSAMPILDEHQRVHEWVGTHTDISEQRQSELDALQAKKVAEDADHAKSSFLTNVSHELRTPLNAIIGYSEMLQEELLESGYTTLVPDLQKVCHAGKHLLELIGALLDLRKVEAGRFELNLGPIDISELVRGVAGIVHPLMEKNKNRFELQIASGVGVMHSDATRIRQSLLNLLSNAAKFTKSGTVVCQAESLGADIVFRVSDTGIGVSAEQMGKLFKPFSQAHPSISRDYGGTGLGLALTHSYCRMMGGDISLSSVPGAGSIFTIRLPRYFTSAVLELQPDVLSDVTNEGQPKVATPGVRVNAVGRTTAEDPSALLPAVPQPEVADPQSAYRTGSPMLRQTV